MAVLFTNNAATNLASSITSGATSLTVVTGTGSLFPNPGASDYFLITLIGISGSPIEIVKCTARSGDTFTIVRAQEGTTASAFTGGDQVQLRITAGEMTQAVNGGTSAGGAVYENTQIINANYTMTTGKNGESVGPISISSGITVTIPASSRWVVL
jgi:hypothetical protein